jgi:sugar/nucleoside kinase (ribokinase family)
MLAGIGPALVDYIHYIEVYPKRGGHTVVKKSIRMAGGAGANVVCGLSKYGVRCRFYSTIGDDDDAKFFIQSMEGVDLKLEVTHERTGKVDIYVDSNGERTFFVHPNASGVLDLNIDNEDFKELDYIYLDPFPVDSSFDFQLDIARRSKEFGVKVVTSLSYPYVVKGFETVKRLLKFTDLVLTSKPEFEILRVSEEDVLDYVDVLVITMGEKGSKAVTSDGEIFQRAFKVEKVVDTTGAGDSFAVGFLLGIIRNLGLSTCLKLGNFIASYNVQHFGARNYPSPRAVEELLNEVR